MQARSSQSITRSLNMNRRIADKTKAKSGPQSHLVYFAFDRTNEGIRRRLNEAVKGGYRVTMFAFDRVRPDEGTALSVDRAEVRVIKLGQTSNGNYLRRVGILLRAVGLVFRNGDAMERADVIVARNLDMALLALLGRAVFAKGTPFVYEVLDVVPVMTRRTLPGIVARAAERLVLRVTRALIVSSPGFLRGYFQLFHRHVPTPILIENKVSFPTGTPWPPRSPAPPLDEEAPVWVIGWFGKFRCRASLDLLTGLAQRFSDRVEIYLRGFPSQIPPDEFEAAIAGLPNIRFGGGYQTPVDLPAMMAQVHFNWCGDLPDGLRDTRWLLLNRIYEGGYFGVPALTIEGSETSDYIKRWELGYTLPSADLETLVDFVDSLTPKGYWQMRARLAQRPASEFVDDGAFPRALRSVVAGM